MYFEILRQMFSIQTQLDNFMEWLENIMQLFCRLQRLFYYATGLTNSQQNLEHLSQKGVNPKKENSEMK